MALLALLRLARRTDADFTFSPLRPLEVVQQGLQVSGAESLVRQTLAAVDGVAQAHTVVP